MVKRYMTANPLTVRSDDSIWHALKMLRRRRIRHLPVLQGKRLVGMLSDRDLRLLLPSSLAEPEEQQRFRAWGPHVKVSDVMTRKVVTVGPGTGAEEAAELMVKHRIGCLPVLQGSTLIGIITTVDLLAALTEKGHATVTLKEGMATRRRKTAVRPPTRGGRTKRARRG